MKIDLAKYLKEVRSVEKAAEQFVTKDAVNRLHAMADSLETGATNRPETFTWRTEEGKPIVTIAADAYDSLEKKQSEPVVLHFDFCGTFRRGATKKDPWHVVSMVSHIKIFKSGTTEPELLHFHVDKRNEKQLGPGLHLQIAEKYVAAKGGVKLAVPRIPFGYVLPTDCLDFALAEFFPVAWGKAQLEAHDITSVRDGQLARSRAFGEALVAKFKNFGEKRSPVSVLQNWPIPENFSLN